MKNYICVTCGTQYAASETPPEKCSICEDERQYVPEGGQQWTTLDKLQKNHKLIFHKIAENLYGIGANPKFGIGQRALLVTTPAGNILWDCISLINDTACDLLNALGGLDAIAISHPHYYSSMIEWSRAFGDIPVYLHENDRQWVQRNDATINFWSGQSKKILQNLTLYNAGGHFDGGTILHWPEGAEHKGALLTGDILQVTADRRHLSFMYSYPNDIPLNKKAVQQIKNITEPLTFDKIYGAWWGRNIPEKAKEAVNHSAERYIRAIN